MNVKLLLRYDGTKYHGWQIQNKDGKAQLPTVQGELGKAIEKLYGIPLADPSEPTGVSRTDAGVHANTYCANFHTPNGNIPAEKISYALKQFLPEDIVVYNSEEAADDFHARFDVISKTYKYLFYTSEFALPYFNDRAWHAPVRGELDLEAMQKAAANIIGTHEFDAFCAAGGSAKTTLRTIYRAEVKKLDDAGPDCSLYALYVEGNGFLYNMVRIITGTVLYAGCGKIPPDAIPEIIASKNRKKAGVTAPAHGLYLDSLKYPEN